MTAQIARRRAPLMSGGSSVGVVLVVDDQVKNVQLLERLLTAEGYAVLQAFDGQQAVAAVLTHRPDVVVMDVRMPRKDGFSACRDLKGRSDTVLTPIVLMTGLNERGDRLQAIEAGADDFLTKPIDGAELRARVRSLVRIKHYTDELDSAEAVILSLGLTVEARSPYTHGHCERLAHYGVLLGRRLGLPAEDLAALHGGGFLHDLGKIGVPDAILFKEGPLNAAETHLMQQHTLIGDQLCGELKSLHRVRPIVRNHHERLDGTGYPDGLSGRKVPLLAQIVSIADLYDAMTTDRPYRKARTRDTAFEALTEEVAKGWRDRALVDEFIAATTSGDLVLPVRIVQPASRLFGT
ncbi:MAG: HD domain-containing phosphohydrolase [Acidobacteriota bacterium]